MVDKDKNTSTSVSTRVSTTKLLWLLIKNRLIAQMGIHVFRYEKDKKKKNHKIAVTIAMGICIITLFGYSAALAYGYAYIGLIELIPGIALVISSLFTLFYSIFKTNGELFHYRDYDMIMSLPIPIKTVIHSRLINMYIWNSFITILVMFPMGLVYAGFAKPPITFYVMWYVGILLTSLIPTTFAAVIGAIITGISARFRYAHALSTVLSLLFVIIVVMFPTTISTSSSSYLSLLNSSTGDLDISSLKALAPVISESLNKIYPPVKMFTTAVVEGEILQFLFFSFFSIGWYTLFVQVLSVKYKQINTALTSQKSSGSYVLKSQHARSMVFALYKKTIFRILKSSVCATNLLISCLLALIFSTAILIAGPEKVMNGLDMSEHMGIVKNGAAYLIAGMVCMTNTSAISLSLEGKNIWIIHSLPIAPKTLYDSYLLTNLTFTVPTSLICSVLFSISLRAGQLETFHILFTTISFAIFTAIIGIFIGNRFGFYDWQEETQLIKQSFLSMLGMLGGTVFIIICGLIANAQIIPIQSSVLSLILDLLLLLIGAMIYRNECNRQIKK